MKKFRELRKELSEKLNSYTDVSNMTPEQRKKYQQEKLMAARNKLSKSNVAISRDDEMNKDAVQEEIFNVQLSENTVIPNNNIPNIADELVFLILYSFYFKGKKVQQLIDHI